MVDTNLGKGVCAIHQITFACIACVAQLDNIGYKCFLYHFNHGKSILKTVTIKKHLSITMIVSH